MRSESLKSLRIYSKNTYNEICRRGSDSRTVSSAVKRADRSPAKANQRESIPQQDPRQILESQGMHIKGEANGYIVFDDPKTGSTLQMKPEEITPESVASHIEESQKRFEKPRSANAQAALSPQSPTVEPKIISAVAQVGDKQYEGASHEEALNKAGFCRKIIPQRARTGLRISKRPTDG